MSITRKVASHTITCAIAQVVGELEQLGQTCRISDVATFLGCTKATAKKYATKAIWSQKIVAAQAPYRPNRTMTVYGLGKVGKSKFGSDDYLYAKSVILRERGIINE